MNDGQRINKHGLSRSIPQDVKRLVSQKCGFGCVICGKAIYQYEHVDPPFSEATSAWFWVLAIATVTAPAERWSVVDPQGVLRWRDDGSEIALFGVNYYAPFTIDHEGLAALGEDHRRTIERDVAHFQRLGLDAIRLHVFDRQISDLEGNLVATEHLDLFDYLVFCCRQRPGHHRQS